MVALLTIIKYLNYKGGIYGYQHKTRRWFFTHTRIHAETENRSVPKQIEYLAKVGQIMAGNPNLSY